MHIDLDFTLSQFGFLEQLYHVRLGCVPIIGPLCSIWLLFCDGSLNVLLGDMWVELKIMLLIGQVP